MIWRHVGWVAALAVAATSGCPGCSSSGDHADGDAGLVLAACGWPSTLDPMQDASKGQCLAARTYLSCEVPDGGGGELCLSDDPARCPVPGAVDGVTVGNCQDLCKPDEYAVACGGVGPGPWPSPPAACRTLPPGPGGGSVACCPCGADAQPSDAATDVITTFDCGGTVTCDGASQICEHVAGGAPPGVDFHSCVPAPAACSGDLSCACVVAALQSHGAGGCSAPGGHITVQINVP